MIDKFAEFYIKNESKIKDSYSNAQDYLEKNSKF